MLWKSRKKRVKENHFSKVLGQWSHDWGKLTTHWFLQLSITYKTGLPVWKHLWLDKVFIRKRVRILVWSLMMEFNSIIIIAPLSFFFEIDERQASVRVFYEIVEVILDFFFSTINIFIKHTYGNTLPVSGTEPSSCFYKSTEKRFVNRGPGTVDHFPLHAKKILFFVSITVALVEIRPGGGAPVTFVQILFTFTDSSCFCIEVFGSACC